jgi:hypothetical protein
VFECVKMLTCLKQFFIDLYAYVRVVEFLISQHIVLFHRLQDSFLAVPCMFILFFL